MIICSISTFMNIIIEVPSEAFMNYRLLTASCALSNFVERLISHMALSPDLYSATGVTSCPRYLCVHLVCNRGRRASCHIWRAVPRARNNGATRKPLQRQETRRPTLETRRAADVVWRARFRVHAVRIRSLTSCTVMCGVGAHIYARDTPRLCVCVCVCVFGEYRGTHLLISLCST